jgi:hypothetical protein
LNFTSFDPIRALFWSAIINGVVAVQVMVLMMLQLDRFAAPRLYDRRSSLLVRRWPDVVCACLKILHDDRKVKLVAGAGETPKTHAFEAMVDLEVCEAHLHFLALIT